MRFKKFVRIRKIYVLLARDDYLKVVIRQLYLFIGVSLLTIYIIIFGFLLDNIHIQGNFGILCN